jgi:hypothetical protein
MSQVWKEYQNKNKERFLDEMMDLLRIPSVSAKTEHKADMIKCADAVKKSRSNGHRWPPGSVR